MKVKFTIQSLQDYFSFNIAKLTHFVSGNINMSEMIAKHPKERRYVYASSTSTILDVERD